MKKKNLIILIVVFVVLIAGAVFGYNYLSEKYAPKEAAKTTETQKVQTAPDFTVMDYEGTPINLSDFRGKKVIVNFWATWCGPCKSELPAFDKMYAQYKDDVEFLMVNLTDGQQETEPNVKAFVAENGYSFPVYFDTEYSATYAYSVYSIPLTVFINEDGYLVDYHTGAMSESMLERYVTNFIAQ